MSAVNQTGINDFIVDCITLCSCTAAINSVHSASANQYSYTSNCNDSI